MKTAKEKIDIFCDGGARGNPGPAAIGVVAKNSEGKVIFEKSQSIGKATNNIAEYKAAIASLEWIRRHSANANQPTNYRIFIDSRLVVNQLQGKFKVKNDQLKRLILKARRLENEIALAEQNNDRLFNSAFEIDYILIPRSRNQEADLLVNKALDQLLD